MTTTATAPLVASSGRIAEAVAEALSFEERAPHGQLLVQQANRVTHHLLTLGVFREEQPAAAAEKVVWHCAHCGVPIDQFEDDFQWSSLGDFGGTGTGALTERLWCEEGPGHEHSPNYAPEAEPRLLPTRDQLAGVIHPDCTSGPGKCPNWDEALKSADRVLALLGDATQYCDATSSNGRGPCVFVAGHHDRSDENWTPHANRHGWSWNDQGDEDAS